MKSDVAFQKMTHCLIFCVSILFANVLHAQPASVAPLPYLDSPSDKLNYVLLPPPQQTLTNIERSQVLAAQLSADSAVQKEAYEDAEAYLPDMLMQRFSLAAGETLNRGRRPILAHMLFRLWRNVDGYTSYLKGLNVRDRPFLNDPTLHPCDLSYLQPSDHASYPSGHATDGFSAALLLIDVQKGGAATGERDRADLLLARGARFGFNRLVCGVHYPSDVLAGQAFAAFLYAKVTDLSDFKQDLICARMEDLADRKGALGKQSSFSGDCWTKAQTYAAESHSL